MEKSTIRSFTDLNAWKRAHDLTCTIYRSTQKFPKEERYGLTNQIRRAALSISSNIAEGFSRRTSSDKKQFYYIALGSLTEVQNQILVARDLQYINKELFSIIASKTIVVSKLINGLLKSSTSHT